MSVYSLPKSAVVGGREYLIRSDYRAILDIIEVMNDTAVPDDERTFVVLSVFYVDFDSMPAFAYQEAINYCTWFINGGEEQPTSNKAKLMDWEQDFSMIVAPVNRVLGCEIRDVEYLHWWSFLSAYQEIGECLFAHVVSIRKKKQRGIKLDKQDQQFYREHKELIDFKSEKLDEDMTALEAWIK